MKKENKDKSKRIVHIILSDKFTSGYINYMLKEFDNYEHTIIYVKGKYKLDLLNEEYKKNIIEVEDKKDILNKEILNLMKESKKIVVSGIFGLERYLILLPHKILKKVYMQFWGGDFYTYRETKIFSKKFLHKVCLHYCIKRCGGIINLISGDYEQLCKIFPNKTKNYIAAMPDDPRKKDIYLKYVDNKSIKGKIIVGNSATKENHHIEVFEMIKHLKNEDIQIVCPLSYGDKEYANQVIDTGKKIFGEKFSPIVEYMDYEKYVELLSTCNVGIYYNDRQQGMGNINTLLRLGKKVYLRKGTSMWNNYKKNNFILFDVDELNNIYYNNLIEFNENFAKENYYNMLKRDKMISISWKNILDS